MDLIRGLHNLRARHHGCVASIGNFDGVHRGHRQVLELLKEEAAARGLPSTVIAFEPTPREFFEAVPPARLTNLREKYEALAAVGIDRFLALCFDERLRGMTAEEFVETILTDGLGVRFLSVGSDFRFGQDRSGDYETLKQAGEQHGFEVAAAEDFLINAERVSSSAIRRYLSAGELDMARTMLGRYYRMSGRVVCGEQLGRELGYPTVNIRIERSVSPVQGIFAVCVSGAGLEQHPAVASVGTRPTVDGKEFLLEVHLFDIERDLYHEYLNIDFVKKLRDEMKFSSMAAMRLQMEEDEASARVVLDALKGRQTR